MISHLRIYSPAQFKNTLTTAHTNLFNPISNLNESEERNKKIKYITKTCYRNASVSISNGTGRK